MARPLRIEFSGALYRLISRGNERRAKERGKRVGVAGRNCRVGPGDCSPRPLAEPDLWAAHPAPRVDISENSLSCFETRLPGRPNLLPP